MSMEQTPAHVCEALGTEFKTSAQLEAGISNMTAEDFSKLSNVLNSFDDRGNYIGNNNVGSTSKVGAKSSLPKIIIVIIIGSPQTQ